MMKKLLIICILMLFMAGSVYAANCGGAAPCNCGDTLIENYIMTASLSCDGGDAITIGADNLVLDCDNYQIHSTNNNGNGVLTLGRNGTTIQNCFIDNFDDGIDLSNSHGNKIINTTSIENDVYGIRMWPSSNNLIDNCNLNSSSTDTQSDIYMRDSQNNIITNSRFGDQLNSAIVIASSDDITISNNSFIAIGNDAIVINYGCDRVLVENNNITVNGDGINIDCLGDSARICNNNTIRNNYIHSLNQDGIALIDYSFGAEIYNNILYYNSGGGSDFPIYLFSTTSGTRIYNNTIINAPDDGINIAGSDNNIIEGNNISNSYDSGIYILTSSINNTIRNNRIFDNGKGIIIFDIGSVNNIIYNNYFENTINVNDSGFNYWNTSYQLGPNIIGGSHIMGNYYDDYLGLDDGSANLYHPAVAGDGVGDTLLPYDNGIINGADYGPLILGAVCGNSDCEAGEDENSCGVDCGGTGAPCDDEVDCAAGFECVGGTCQLESQGIPEMSQAQLIFIALILVLLSILVWIVIKKK